MSFVQSAFNVSTDIDSFMELHQAVTAKTPFVKPRSKESVSRHLFCGHHAIALYDVDGQMVAQALVALPDKPGASNLEGYPFKEKLSDYAVVQSVGVHPQYNGRGLCGALFDIAANIAEKEGRSRLVAKIHAFNFEAQSVFAKAGYRMISNMACIPGDDYRSVFMQKTLRIPAFAKVRSTI